MATIPQKKKKTPPPVERKPDNPRRLYMSKADAVEENKKLRKARKAREAAYNKSMAESNLDIDPKIAKAEAHVLRDKQLVKVSNQAIASIEEELKEAEGSEKTKLRRDIKKAKANLEIAVETLEKTENVLEELKA